MHASVFTISIRAKKASSPTKRKTLEVVEQGPEKRLRLEYNRKEQEVRMQTPETQTRLGRIVKRTSKARNRA
jgi:hypothetical protein